MSSEEVKQEAKVPEKKKPFEFHRYSNEMLCHQLMNAKAKGPKGKAWADDIEKELKKRAEAKQKEPKKAKGKAKEAAPMTGPDPV